MFSEVADKPSSTNGFAPTARKVLELDVRTCSRRSHKASRTR